MGDWCFTRAIAHARGSLTLEGISVQISATLGGEMAKGEQPDSLASPWQPSWLGLINLPHVCCVNTSHYINSYLMGFTQFMSLRPRTKKMQRVSRDQQVMVLGDLLWEGRKERKRRYFFFVCFFPCSLQESDDFHVIFIKAIIFFILFVTSVHVQFIQKVRQHSVKVNHSRAAHNRSFSITTQLQYL